MNINPMQANLASFGCNDPTCKGHCHQAQIVSTQPMPDVVEMSTGEKAKQGIKKGITFVKENKKGIAVTLKAALTGFLTACTILGANQLMSKVAKGDTSKLASKLALIGGLAAGGTQLIRDRKAFKKEVQQ